MKVLLIMPNFFNYPEQITKELNAMGYDVDFFDDRPSTSALIKALIRINKNIINIYIKKYFNNVMQKISQKKYNYVFIISGQSLSFSQEMIAQLKKNQSSAKFILYQWDSQKNFPYIKSFHHFFDECYSFDKEDVKETPNLKFLPLFYCDLYRQIGINKTKSYKYDFCFVGTAHPKKYKFINIISNQLKSVYPNQFIYYYFPSPIVYIYRKAKNKEFKNAKYKEFHFSALNESEMNQLYKSSRCVLDSAQDGQLGLTIRVFEALGAKKKLITTNKDIKNYDFYKPENIYIYNGKIDLTDIFFNSNYVDINKEIYEKYSLKNWLKQIIK